MTDQERETEEARVALALLRQSEVGRGSAAVFISTGGQSALVRQGVPEGERPHCAGCGEPIELDDPDDVESWIHAHDANDRGDHTAWLDD